MWCTLLPWKSMKRRPARSSIQIPSALAMALRHGVETDWCRKARASRSRSAFVRSSSARACQAARRLVRLVSPSEGATEDLGIDEPTDLMLRCEAGHGPGEP